MKFLKSLHSQLQPNLLHNSLFLSLPSIWFYLNFSPVKRMQFYPFTLSDPPFFESIVPKLKQSLSLTLHHFLPVAGNLVWPEDSSKPFILYTPNDAVSFTVAETDSDFNYFSSHHAIEVTEYEPLIPTVPSSDTQLPILVLQVTKFSNDGFSIGVAFHHVLFDGVTLALFWKAWAYICRKTDLNELEPFSLLPELTPSFDRGSSLLQIPSDFTFQNKSLKPISMAASSSSTRFKAAFTLTRANIQKLKRRVLDAMEESSSEKLHISTFVVAYSYSLVCLIKAQQEESHQKLAVFLMGDARGLLNPPISSNYFGNCLSHSFVVAEAREFKEEGGFLNAVKKVSDLILELRRSNGIKAFALSEFQKLKLSEPKIFAVASAPKFKHYETDFGWGKPKKIEQVLGNNFISLTDAREGGDGVEVGVVLPTYQQMEDFASLFTSGLN